MNRSAVGVGFYLLALLTPSLAVAQPEDEVARWRVSTTFASDYRYRGLSLSDRRLSLQLAGAYDHPSGGHVGLFAAAVRRAGDPSYHTLLVPYAGFANAIGVGQSWDVGIAYAVIPGLRQYDYAELYAGMSGERWGARLSFAQHYYGVTNTAYAEWNAHRPIDDQWRAFVHAGALIGTAGTPAPDSRGKARYDVQTGLAFERDSVNVQLSLVGSNIVGVANDFSFGENQKRLGIVLSATCAF